MSNAASTMVVKTEIAKPLHIQLLEKNLNLDNFLNEVEHYLKQPDNDDDDLFSDSDAELSGVDLHTSESVWNATATTKQDRISDKLRLYNLTSVGNDRQWLQQVLLSDTSESSGEEITEDDLKQMLKLHVLKRKYRKKFYKDPKNRQYQYYSTGLLSNFDKFPEHQLATTGGCKKRKVNGGKKEKHRGTESQDDGSGEDSKRGIKEEFDDELRITSRRKSGSHKKKAPSQAKTIEVLTHRRRKMWANMAKKEIGKVQRCRANNHKEMLTSCKRVATYCVRHWRQKALQSQRNMKETLWRAKRLTREMQMYWKRYERVERETRRRMEKEAEEQRKLDVELMEAKRQQRKLNFLITQTELYAHFMSRKLGEKSAEEQLRILNQLEEEVNPRLSCIDDYDCEAEKERVRMRVEFAFKTEEERTREFGCAPRFAPNFGLEKDLPQPNIFRGSLKGYQIKGMTWLANLYDQGINGILADEMGLGKTVQSIAFLCHIAEKYSVWGPFLIISPASTLHNWQQEMQRFVPDFKVVPYWGNQQERKILRQFWDLKGIHTKEASFHVVITSYQLVISDIKYFNRIKWQYLILDEAQAIKSTTSMRWKMLLGFNCRNRLLLSGTPIQNSMAELWALLHFIMPSMFDSHDEFNEWFSKDIESHAEHKTSIDERHLSRLHMILKPFMLRRVKTDVENELSDKIEIMVYCPLTTRQKMLYSALKKKIKIEDLLHSSGPSFQPGSAQSITSSLMNLVMQFRKVCNHPELFERREPGSPFSFKCEDYVVPKLIAEEGTIADILAQKNRILFNNLCIFMADYVNRSLNEDDESPFAILKLLKLSSAEISNIFLQGILYRWLHIFSNMNRFRQPDEFSVLLQPAKISKQLQFTSATGRVYTHTSVNIHSIPETLEHRILRSRKVAISAGPEPFQLLPEFPHVPRKPKVFECVPVELPRFLNSSILKVEVCKSKDMYSHSRAWAWKIDRHKKCDGVEGTKTVWYGSPELSELLTTSSRLHPIAPGGLLSCRPIHGWSNIIVPDKQTLVTDAGKLTVLDSLLTRLKQQGHRALIYSQMTRMIDLLEEYMWFRKHTYMRLDGSSKISDRRDMVADFQNRADIFVFLLSTRAGGLGINLTAADTVIFYDSDWNPTVDQQAMDRAHRLGQTKQVTVYRLICKGTIEERILQRAQEKSEIQRMVISGGNFKPDTLKPKEVVSLLLDDAEIEEKYRQKQAERKLQEENKLDLKERERKRKNAALSSYKDSVKQIKTEDGGIVEVYQGVGMTTSSIPGSPPLEMSPVLQHGESFGSSIKSEPLGTPKRPMAGERVKAKRGRPPRSTLRGGLSRPSVTSMPPIALGNSVTSPGGGGNNIKRGPGRPRLKPAGPSNQGNRGSRIITSNIRGRVKTIPSPGNSSKTSPNTLPLTVD
ncbi:DNA helicase [Nesidiocoris tenuis]|uniref:Chromatin-remodeling ATPase INO80 n=1 Tax=Nesidiocoris tenuis TaxID=355587 RepID=A0ABN7ALC6_9HEMI|nr:DNA helicase [Nesidiocoris tenuis]